MLRRFFGGIRDFFGGLGGGREAPPPPPEEPPSPPPEEPEDFEPEEPEEIPPELPGSDVRPLDDEGKPVLVWIKKGGDDTSNYTRTDLRRKDYDNQADAINYAKKIRVPTIVFKDEDGNWQIAIDYP